MMSFIKDFWPKLQGQVTCPAKSLDPKACYGCADQQVTHCLVANEHVHDLIKIRRK